MVETGTTGSQQNLTGTVLLGLWGAYGNQVGSVNASIPCSHVTLFSHPLGLAHIFVRSQFTTFGT